MSIPLPKPADTPDVSGALFQDGIERIASFSEDTLADILRIEHASYPQSWYYEDEEEHYAAMLRDPRTVHLFLKVGGHRVGYLLGRPHTDLFDELAEHDPLLTDDPQSCYIETTAILPAYAGRMGLPRLTRALADHLLKHTEHGLCRISAHARVTNRVYEMVKLSYGRYELIEDRVLESWHFGGGEPYRYLRWNLYRHPES
jgi:ribosomal protein S18 acetylase RimI-like enzyme